MYFYGYYVLNLNPTILAFLGTPYALPEWLKPDALIEHIPWWHGRFRSMAKRKIMQVNRGLSGTEHHLMVHAREEEIWRKRLGVRGALISQNIFIDEKTYSIKPLEKKYDAVYVAQMQPFKRHALASKVKNLYIVTGQSENLHEFCPEVAHASYNQKRLDKSEVATVLNQSRCSLALSEIEGGMLAAFESTLCGIPIVSTPSKGGRDEFFTNINSVIVEPDALAVSNGVDKWIRNPIDPVLIRDEALQMQLKHRLKFCSYLSKIIEKKGGGKTTVDKLYVRLFEETSGGLSRFIWANTFDNSEQLARVQNT
jgi:glycosyltransferase involved in cell wall biosynthesis